MIFWCITFCWAILGTALFWWLVSREWESHIRCSGGGASWQERIALANTCFQFSITDGYGNYKASIFRHMLAFLASATIIYNCADTKWIMIGLFGLNSVYAGLPFRRVWVRIGNVINKGNETQDFLIPMAQDGSFVSWYSAICVAVLFLLLLIL